MEVGGAQPEGAAPGTQLTIQAAGQLVRVVAGQRAPLAFSFSSRATPNSFSRAFFRARSASRCAAPMPASFTSGICRLSAARPLTDIGSFKSVKSGLDKGLEEQGPRS